jgi:hypothetical protein
MALQHDAHEAQAAVTEGTLDTRAEMLDRAFRYLTAIRSITDSIQETLDGEDFALCVVRLLQRQDYVRQLALLGHRLAQEGPGDAEGASDPGVREIRALVDHIILLDRTYEQQLLSIRQSFVQRMQDMANTRRILRQYHRQQFPESRLVDVT